jgi:CHAD domain-containing protein
LSEQEDQVFYECEAELLPDGHMEQLSAVMDALDGQWHLVPEGRSKFERGLALVRPGLVLDIDGGQVAGEDGNGNRPKPSSDYDIWSSDHMAEAVRKILAQQLQEMVAHQEGSRSGEDIDDLHDMRVATRRMRAAFRLFGSYFQPKSIRRIKKDLRRTGRTLGAVRDLDVFDKKATSYLKGLPKEDRHGLDPLLDHWHEQRKTAREVLATYLDSERYQRLVLELGSFVATEGAGVEPVPPGEPACVQVRHVLGSSIWQLAEKVRAYEVVLDGASKSTLHALRIDCKRLRYTLEFFQEVLGPETPGLVRDVVAIQDHLGDLQDAEVAAELLQVFLLQRQGEPNPVDLTGVVAYLDYRKVESQDLVATFPEAWLSINNLGFRERLAQAIVPL